MQRHALSFTRLVAMVSLFTTFSSTLSANAAATPLTYQVSQDVQGTGFYDAFDFENIPDPTNGRVNYVDGPTAMSQNLTFGCNDTFILRPDSQTVLNPNGPGRNSVRLRSKQNYTNHVAVFDIRHMPQGCGTWPAVWEVDPTNWPIGGELDILEGVNDDGPNASTLHTSPGCVMPPTRLQLGSQVADNCDATVNSNIGCPVKFPTPQSFGPVFNQNGGGWYAIERSPAFINVWFWARNDTTVPPEVQNGQPTVSPSTWGTPTAFFPQNTCDIDTHFAAHNIIINLSLCGDWAGSTYSQTSCPSTCVDFVNNNPAAFSEAYFDFAAMRVYLPSS